MKADVPSSLFSSCNVNDNKCVSQYCAHKSVPLNFTFYYSRSLIFACSDLYNYNYITFCIYSMCLNIGKNPHYWIIDLSVMLQGSRLRRNLSYLLKKITLKKYFCTTIYVAVGFASMSHRYTEYFHVWESNEAFEI